MAELSELLALIPKDYPNLRATVKLMAEIFPEQFARLTPAFITRQVETKSDDDARDDIFKYVVGSETIQKVLGVDADTAEKLILGKDEGGLNFSELEETRTAREAAGVGVLRGGQTVSVRAGDGMVRFYQVYEYPPGSGHYVAYQFDSKKQMEAALGEGASITRWSETKYNNLVVSEAAAEEVVGLPGSWQGYYAEIERDVGRLAGVTDPTLLGEFLSNPEVANLMVQAQLGNWSDAQLTAELRKTSYYTEVLYPGIANFYGRTANPEQAYADYYRTVQAALVEAGVERDADGSYNTVVSRLLTGGVEAEAVEVMAPAIARANTNARYAATLNKYVRRELGRELTYQEWFEAHAGVSVPEIGEVIEKAELEYQAGLAGFDVTRRQINRLSRLADFTEPEAQNLFAQVTNAVLALGPEALRRYNLSNQDVLYGYAGLGGKKSSEVRRLVAKIARENDLFDEEQLNFYVGFTPQGTPFRPGLTTLAPEGA